MFAYVPMVSQWQITYEKVMLSAEKLFYQGFLDNFIARFFEVSFELFCQERIEKPVSISNIAQTRYHLKQFQEIESVINQTMKSFE